MSPALPFGFPRHAAVEIKPDVYLDAFGIQSLEEIEKRMGARLRVDREPSTSKYPFENIPEEELLEAQDMAIEMIELRAINDENHAVWTEILASISEASNQRLPDCRHFLGRLSLYLRGPQYVVHEKGLLCPAKQHRDQA